MGAEIFPDVGHGGRSNSFKSDQTLDERSAERLAPICEEDIGVDGVEDDWTIASWHLSDGHVLNHGDEGKTFQRSVSSTDNTS